MVGAELCRTPRPGAAGEVVLELTGCRCPPPALRHAAARHRLTVRAGEVLGIGGVAGNGQDELLAALSGERRAAPAPSFWRAPTSAALGPWRGARWPAGGARGTAGPRRRART